MSKANGFTRQEVLNAIKIRGPKTADDLASLLGISPVAVRQHVSALEAEGYIQTSIERRGLGRPVHRYSLTQRGDETFPRNYDELAFSILDEVKALYGEEALEQILIARRKRAAAMLRARLNGLAPRERLAELIQVQNKTGYMAQADEKEDCIVLREHNCPICQVAQNYPAACREELELFREVLGPECTVEVQESIGDGARSCAYRITIASSAELPG